MGSFKVEDIVILCLWGIGTLAVGTIAILKTDDSGDSYFFAGRSQSTCVVAVSLLSGLTSGISALANPSFGYEQGLGSIFSGFAMIFPIPFIAFYVLPLFFRLQLTTSYDYLAERYDPIVAHIASAGFLFKSTLYLGLVLYAPALVMETIFKIKLYICILVCGGFSTLWACKGGMTAVVYLDFMQSIILSFGYIFVMICIIHQTPGGWSALSHELESHDKLIDEDFFTPKPTSTIDFYSIVFGFSFACFAQFGTDQIAIQRYLTTPTLRESQKSLVGGSVLNFICQVIQCLCGVLLYGYYAVKNQDPKQEVDTNDEILPNFVLTELPAGSAGILTAAILGCTISVSSATLNSLSMITIAQFIKPEEDRIVYISKFLTLGYGIIGILLAFLAAALGNLYVLTQVVQAIVGGPVAGCFLLGMFTTEPATTNVLIGLGFGLLISIYLSTANMVDSVPGFSPFLTACFGTITTFITGWLSTHAIPADRDDLEENSVKNLTIWIAPEVRNKYKQVNNGGGSSS